MIAQTDDHIYTPSLNPNDQGECTICGLSSSAHENIPSLIGKVSQGIAEKDDFENRWPMAMNFEHTMAFAAYSGSLNAAQQLHEALVPTWSVFEIDQDKERSLRREWMVCLRDDQWKSWDEIPGTCVTHFDNNLARAWLMAILDAVECQR